MVLDDWSVVLASTPISDLGWLVFDDTGAAPKFMDAWVALVGEGDRPELLCAASRRLTTSAATGLDGCK